MSNSLTPTTANIPHMSPPIPSRRINHETEQPLPSPTHDTVSPPKERPRRINMTQEHASSPSDTSSQSGMADNETEAERSQQSERSAPTAPLPKKKRTRTLTTPHQSAVLHALLAKSRFPTTAMREEVGRQIGLSARKVQIWFQNQRQKARRPQSDSAPLSHPPQFGPFSSMPSSSHTAPITEPFFPSTPDDGPSQTAVPESGRSLDPGLSGPGIPGRRMSPYPSSAEEYPHHVPASPEPPTLIAQPTPHRVIQEFPSLTLREPVRLLAPRPFLVHDNQQSPPSSRMLPPIYSSTLESRTSIFPHVLSTSSSQPLQSPTNTIHHSPASHHTGHPISALPGIPPPFALQPQPQWDLDSFIPYTRPDFMSFSSSPARRGISIPGTRDRFVPHVSPDLARRREYSTSSGEHLSPLSSQAYPNTLCATVDSPSGWIPTRSSQSRLRDPQEYSHLRQQSSTGDDGVHPDDGRPHRDH